ncbi:MAG: hypothetical protein KJO07_06135 [Deltaproteobacteria bacterium]|nr:hypothetical protein [Deltaproteobacteria bacterium]
MARAIILASFVVGLACSGSDTSVCSNGAVCPRGLLCSDATSSCVTPEQLSACSERADGVECEFLGNQGICAAGVCLDGSCGDGIRAAGEACDDGNTLDGDGCSSDCLSSEVCGNGVVDSDQGEQCDCGADELSGDCEQLNSDLAGAACRADCLDHCGDGVVNAAEECDGAVSLEGACLDFGFDRGPLSCADSCDIDLSQCASFGFTFLGGPGVPTSTMTDVDILSGGEIFAIGTDALAHLDGIWSLVSVGPDASVFGVSASSPSLAYAVGVQEIEDLDLGALQQFGALWRFNGNGWAQDTAPEPSGNGSVAHRLNDVWVGGGGVVTVGHAADLPDKGRVYDRQGGLWLEVATAPGEMTAVDGAGDLVVAVGENGHYLTRKSLTWDRQRNIAGAPDLLDVWVSDDGTAFAVGKSGAIRYYNGTGWEAQESNVNADITRVSGRSSTDVYAVVPSQGLILHFDGSSWFPIPYPEGASLQATACTESVALFGGTLMQGYRLDNGAWGRLRYLPTTDTDAQTWSVDGDGDQMFILDRDSVLRWNGNSLEVLGTNAAGVREIAAFGNDALAIRSTTLELYSDGQPTTLQTFGKQIYEVSATAPDHIFVAGKDSVFWSVEAAWEQQDIPPTAGTIVDIASVGATAYLVTSLGEVWTNASGSWVQDTTLAGPRPRTLWVAETGEVFVGGAEGAMWWKDAGGWQQAAIASQPILDISGSSAGDVFAVTLNEIYRYDGTSWSAVRATTRPMLGVYAAGDVFVVHDDKQLGRLIRLAPW